MSGLETLRQLRMEARDRAQETFARRLGEVRLAEELLRRAIARWSSQRSRCAERAEGRLSALGTENRAGVAVVHARHETRLRVELEVLAFGREVARRELAARSTRSAQARGALERAAVSLAVLERLLDGREQDLRARQRRREEGALEDGYPVSR